MPEYNCLSIKDVDGNSWGKRFQLKMNALCKSILWMYGKMFVYMQYYGISKNSNLQVGSILSFFLIDKTVGGKYSKMCKVHYFLYLLYKVTRSATRSALHFSISQSGYYKYVVNCYVVYCYVV